MNAEMKRLIKALPIKSLQVYFTKFHSDLLGGFDWNEEEKIVREALNKICLSTVGEQFALMNNLAERVDTLTSELGQSMLLREIKKDEVEEYSNLNNEYERAVWLLLKNDGRFTLVEDCYYVDTRRNSRMYNGFIGPKNKEVLFKGAPLEAFKVKILDLFHVVGNIKVELYNRAHPDTDCEIEIIQIMVYREDLPSVIREFEGENLIDRSYKPVKEFALTYDPEDGVIEVVADGSKEREKVALIFAETLLQSSIKGEKIPLKKYKIQKLLNQVELSIDPNDNIESAKVTMLKVARPNRNNTVTLDVSTKEETNIYDISSEYFGENDPLKNGFKLLEVIISIKFRPDDENRKGKVIHVNIGEPNRCNLKGKSQKEKLIGEKYLKGWGLIQAAG